MSLHHASLDEIKDIYAVFKAYPHIFPHMRFDRLQRMIRDGQCIWHEGIVITYQQYKKSVRLGSVTVPMHTTCLHQIGKSKTAASGAASRVFQSFLSTYVPRALVLTVRADNTTACAFYEREGLRQIGEITWSQQGQPLPGYVYASTVFSSQSDGLTPSFDSLKSF